MAEPAELVIPNRSLFNAAEVCELVKVQPYVLRSWEAEFPALGTAKREGGTRLYRRSDVEQVLKIKRLLLVEGLTLGGVRKRLEEENPNAPAVDETLEELIGRSAVERLGAVKRGLRGLLDLLGSTGGDSIAVSVATVGQLSRSGQPSRVGAMPVGRASGRGAAKRRKVVAPRAQSSPTVRRKRSA